MNIIFDALSKFILSCTLVVGLFMPVAWAADGSGSQFGVMYGYSVPDADNVNPYTVFGVRGALLVNSSFGLGGYYLVSSKDDEGTGGEPFGFSLHGVEAAYHLGGSGGDGVLGARIGLSKIHAAENGVKSIFSPYHYGVFCGYDYFLTSWMSIGFEGSLLSVNSSTTETNGINYSLEGFSILSFLVSLQFRL